MWMVDRQVTQPLNDGEAQVWLDESLEYKAVHDALTELPNRYLLQDRLRHALVYSKRYNTHPAVMFIELNGTKKITENFGRKFGDQALREITERLLSRKRESDTLARFGQNEFALLLENISGERETGIVAKRILATLSEPISMNGHKFAIDPTITISLSLESSEDTRILRTIDIETYYNRRQRIKISAGDQQGNIPAE
jgi:diguanylate cyclase (GGDEF)-like protein